LIFGQIWTHPSEGDHPSQEVRDFLNLGRNQLGPKIVVCLILLHLRHQVWCLAE
jgi:hypothetical protein